MNPSPVVTTLIVPLNPNLEESEHKWGKLDRETLIKRLGGGISPKPIAFIGGSDFPENATIERSFLYALSNAYSLHQKISIAPHDLWYVMLTEIARLVNASPDTYRSIFTKSPEKIEICVPTGDVSYLPLDIIYERLKELVPVDVDLFVPQFSTHTPESHVACVAAFADAVKSFYDYMTFCCGINAIEIRGTADDWTMFIAHVRDLRSIMGDSTSEWLTKVENRARLILDSILGGDTDFYHSIFSTTRIGSGGELLVNGWFGQEFFFEGGGRLPKIDNFPSTWSTVPFKNLDTGRKFTDAFGCFSSTVENGFRVSGYGRFTFEIPKT